MKYKGLCWKTFETTNINHINNLFDMKFNTLRMFFNIADIPKKDGLSELSSSTKWQWYINHVYVNMPDCKREWTWEGRQIWGTNEPFKKILDFCKRYNWHPIICIGHIEEHDSWLGKAPGMDKWLWLRRFTKELAIYLKKMYNFIECDLEVYNEPNKFMEVNHYINVATNMAIGWKSGVSAWKVHVGGVDLQQQGYLQAIMANTTLMKYVDYISPHILYASEWDGNLINETYLRASAVGKKLAFLEVSPLGRWDRMEKLVGKCEMYCLLLIIRSSDFGTAMNFDDVLIYEASNSNVIRITSQSKKEFITQYNLKYGEEVIMPTYNANTELTNNFTYGEFFCNGIQPPDEYFQNILNLAKELQKVRDKIKLPIIVNSGWRTIEHNKHVGGEVNSQHLTGKAADVYCPKLETKKFNIYLAKYGGFNGFGIANSYTHVDIRTGGLTIWTY